MTTQKSKHSIEVRATAIALFEKGFGYKAASKVLGISEATVRDWKREWKAGAFSLENRSCAEIVRDVMLEKGQSFFWRGNASLINAVIRSSHHLSLSDKAVQKIMLAVKRSKFFVRLPAVIFTKSTPHAVWKLLSN